MRSIKQGFESVVKENTAWLFTYVRSRLQNKSLTEDLIQEIFLKAFRAYDSYIDEGRLKPWLYRIAQNTLRNYFSSSISTSYMSLDDDADHDESLYHFLSSGITPEDEHIQKELISDIICAVNNRPEQQKQVITYRFFDGLAVSEVAEIMHIPQGSVKSKTHYALQKIREELGIKNNENQKGVIIMECKNAYKYLFMFAKGTLPPEDKNAVKEHIAGCKACSDIVYALEKLIPNLTFAKEDEHSYFGIQFPSLNLTYCAGNGELPAEQLKYLASHNFTVPDGESWISTTYAKYNELAALFDNEGYPLAFTPSERDAYHITADVRKIRKTYPVMWAYHVFFEHDSPSKVTQSKEAPNLYYGSMHNSMGRPVKSALYQAVPAEAENIRIKRGNGVIDCGTCKFAYVDRYVSEEERMTLEYSFLLNKQK